MQSFNQGIRLSLTKSGSVLTKLKLNTILCPRSPPPLPTYTPNPLSCSIQAHLLLNTKIHLIISPPRYNLPPLFKCTYWNEFELSWPFEGLNTSKCKAYFDQHCYGSIRSQAPSDISLPRSRLPRHVTLLPTRALRDETTTVARETTSYKPRPSPYTPC